MNKFCVWVFIIRYLRKIALDKKSMPSVGDGVKKKPETRKHFNFRMKLNYVYRVVDFRPSNTNNKRKQQIKYSAWAILCFIHHHHLRLLLLLSLNGLRSNNCWNNSSKNAFPCAKTNAHSEIIHKSRMKLTVCFYDFPPNSCVQHHTYTAILISGMASCRYAYRFAF